MEHALGRNFPELWLADLFSSQSARKGGVVRRKLRDVEAAVGMDVLQKALRKRGYQAVLNGGTVVIFCNQNPIRRLV